MRGDPLILSLIEVFDKNPLIEQQFDCIKVFRVAASEGRVNVSLPDPRRCVVEPKCPHCGSDDVTTDEDDKWLVCHQCGYPQHRDMI